MSPTYLKWQEKKCTVKDFLTEVLPFTDVDPPGQRKPILEILFGFLKPTKVQDIISVMLRQFDIGELKIAVNEIGSKYIQEIIDGGHRARAIKGYVDGDFPVDGLYFKDLSDELQAKFWNYPIRYVLYPALSNKEKGEMFRITNTVTPVNEQEMLNSYGDMFIANYIRQTVRSTLHILFQCL